jgi:hypothetical protein
MAMGSPEFLAMKAAINGLLRNLIEERPHAGKGSLHLRRKTHPTRD